jgi:predicted Ser/Thr protein kinase
LLALALPKNIKTVLKKLAKGKRSNIFVLSIGNEEKALEVRHHNGVEPVALRIGCQSLKFYWKFIKRFFVSSR